MLSRAAKLCHLLPARLAPPGAERSWLVKECVVLPETEAEAAHWRKHEAEQPAGRYLPPRLGGGQGGLGEDWRNVRLFASLIAVGRELGRMRKA